ncbi:hypothetical protein FRB90_000175, partial [Tulasnella sp. 427]
MHLSAGVAVDSPLPVSAAVSASSPIDVITQASSLQPPISPFAFYMPPSASTAAISSSILQGPSSANPPHNNDMQRQRQGPSQGAVASPSTPASDLTPGSQPAASSSRARTSFSSPSDSTSAHVFLTPSLPSHLQSAGFHNNNLTNNTPSPSSSSSATSGSSPPTSTSSSTAAVARKQLLLQTAGLSGARRGSIGPPSSATTSGLPTSMPSTPTSAINSLPGSPAARMHVMDNNFETKKANVPRPTLSMGMSAGRKKRPTSSSSLSMSVPGPEPTTAVQHHQALAAATSFHANSLFTPPISPEQQHQGGMFPPPHWPLSFTTTNSNGTSLQHHQHRSSVLSATSSSAGSDSGFGGAMRNESLEFGSLNALGDPSGQSFTQQMHSPIDMSYAGSTQLFTSPTDTQLPFTFNVTNGNSLRPDASSSHSLPPSLRMSSVMDTNLSSLSTSSSTTTLKPQGDLSIFRRGSINSPGALSDIIADDFFTAASTNYGAGGGNGSVFAGTNSGSPSPRMQSSPRNGHSRQGSLTSLEPHHQRMENLTRKMMALGLRREEAEARARQATSALPDSTLVGSAPTPADEDLGEVNVLREMVKIGQVSIDDAIARVTASAILKTEAVLSPTAGTPLGTVQEEEEPKFEPGVVFSKKKELAGDADAERDSDNFTMNGLDAAGFDGAIDIKNNLRSPIPIRRTASNGVQQQSGPSSFLDGLPNFQLAPPENRGRANTTSNMPPPTAYSNFNFHPASVPVSGLYGAPVMGPDAAAAPGPGSFGSHGVHPFGMEQQPRHAYPKHVRKTSFDHTVSRAGILSDIGGRHQVNGRPVPPESSLGKRRADMAPHAESYLRGDQQFVETFMNESALTTASSTTDGLPSASFTFTYPPPNAFENYFDMSPSATGAGGLATVPEKSALVGGQDSVLFPTSSPAGLATSPEQLQMAARIAANAVEDGEARLGGPLPGLSQSIDGSVSGYAMLGGMYATNGFDGFGGIDPMMSTMYNTVDPQILAPGPAGDFSRFEASPPGGEWGSGSTPSSTASPEPTFSTSAPVGNAFGHMHSSSSSSTQ